MKITHKKAAEALDALVKSKMLDGPPASGDPDIVLHNYIIQQQDADDRREARPTFPPTFA